MYWKFGLQVLLTIFDNRLAHYQHDYLLAWKKKTLPLVGDVRKREKRAKWQFTFVAKTKDLNSVFVLDIFSL